MSAVEDRVSLRELSQGSGKILAHVKLGQTVIVTERGKDVAKIVPIPHDESPVERLLAEGLIRRGENVVRLPEVVPAQLSTADILAEDRDE